jgi:outer membrane protein assembly factor BamB
VQPAGQTFADPFDVFLSSPVVAQGTIYFGSGADREFSVGSVASSARVVAGTVYFGSADGSLYAIE